MKDANENILKVITQNVQESVEFLEKMFKSYEGKVYKPAPDCFTNISSETGAYNLQWTNSIIIESAEIKAYLAHDLGMFYFQADNFEKSFYYFNLVKEYINSVNDIKLLEINQYAKELKSYLAACKSMLCIELDLDDSLVNTNDVHTRQVVNKMIQIENCLKTNQSDLYAILLEDNINLLLSTSYRLNVETSLKKINADEILKDKISSLNKIRLMVDASCVFGLEKLDSIYQVVEDVIEKVNHEYKNKLIFFLNVNLKNFNKKNQFEIKKILTKYNMCANSRISDEKMEIDDEKILDSTPSSPPISNVPLNAFLSKSIKTIIYF